MAVSDYFPQIQQSAAQYNIPPNVLASVINQESSGNPLAVNPQSGYVGLGQANPTWAANGSYGYGIGAFDPTDANQSIDFTAHYLSALQQKTGSIQGAVSAYSGGNYTYDSLMNGPHAVNVSDTTSGNGGWPSLSGNASTTAGGAVDPQTGVPYSQESVDPGSGTVTGANGQVLSTPLGTASENLLPTLNNVQAWFTRIVIVIIGIGLLIVGAAAFKSGNLATAPAAAWRSVKKATGKAAKAAAVAA